MHTIRSWCRANAMPVIAVLAAAVTAVHELDPVDDVLRLLRREAGKLAVAIVRFNDDRGPGFLQHRVFVHKPYYGAVLGEDVLQMLYIAEGTSPFGVPNVLRLCPPQSYVEM